MDDDLHFRKTFETPIDQPPCISSKISRKKVKFNLKISNLILNFNFLDGGKKKPTVPTISVPNSAIPLTKVSTNSNSKATQFTSSTPSDKS